MRTIAHISDLHFGRTDAAVLEGLRTALNAEQPDVIVVSGDLTQRARSEQFAEAKRFLDSLPRPQVVVPGNHDVPLHNVLARWLTPLAKYRKYIGEDLEPYYQDEEIAVAGMNTARALALKGGRVNRGQVMRACARFTVLDKSTVRIAVTHHPFALPESSTHRTVVGRARMAMTAFAKCNVDIVLSGHLHVSQAVTSETLYAGPHAALLVQAGTGSSSRLRDESNSFNLLRIDAGRVTVMQHVWTNEGFLCATRQRFRRGNQGWIAEASAAGPAAGTDQQRTAF